MLLLKIKNHQREARKQARKNPRAKVDAKILTTLIGELESKTAGSKQEITDDLVIDTIIKFVKNLCLTIEQCDNWESEMSLLCEKDTLESYLPYKLTEEELETLIKIIIAGASDLEGIGYVMNTLNKDHKGTYDGKMAKDIIMREL